MFNRRNFISTASGLGLTAALGGLAFGQETPGGGGSASDPGQILPGPFGYLGGNPSDVGGGTKNEMLDEVGETLEEVGEWEMTVGAGAAGVGAGIFTVTGETGVGAVVGAGVVGFGGGMFIAGAIGSGIGVAIGVIAGDPPRPNYKVSPTCGLPTITGLGTLDPVVQKGIQSALAAFASSASTLAALELWQGAHAANDAQWRTKHRASFVSGWNQMRLDLKTYAQDAHQALEVFKATVGKKPNGMKTLQNKVKQEMPKMKGFVQQELAKLETGFEATCPNDAKLLDPVAANFTPPTSMLSISDVQAKLKRLGQLADRLPVYS